MSKLIANERGYYDGRNREPNEEFEAQEQDVRFLTEGTRPFARFPEAKSPAAEQQQKTLLPETDTTSAQKPKRRYQRRDMQAKE